MAWYYVLSGASHGPVAETEIRNLRAQNVVALDTPVWTEGMTEWVPFSSSSLANGAVAVAVAGPTHPCAECGRLFPADDMIQYEGSWVCAACKPAFFQRIREGVSIRKDFPYATFAQRFTAVFIDGLIMAVVMYPLIFLLAGVAGFTHKDIDPGLNMLVYAIQYVLPMAYDTILVGMYGATFGKMALKIKIIRADGRRVSYLLAFGRHYAKVVSTLIVFIGYLMVLWDDEKRALHDRMCSTRVVMDQSS